MLALAAALPGTGLAELLAMDVDQGMDVLIAHVLMGRRSGGPGDGEQAISLPGGRTVVRAKGGMDVLSEFLR